MSRQLVFAEIAQQREMDVQIAEGLSRRWFPDHPLNPPRWEVVLKEDGRKSWPIVAWNAESAWRKFLTLYFGDLKPNWEDFEIRRLS